MLVGNGFMLFVWQAAHAVTGPAAAGLGLWRTDASQTTDNDIVEGRGNYTVVHLQVVQKQDRRPYVA